MQFFPTGLKPSCATLHDDDSAAKVVTNAAPELTNATINLRILRFICGDHDLRRKRLRTFRFKC